MKERLLQALNQMEICDIHTHLSASHLAARGLHDVLLYHMVVTELYSAGCPDGARLAEDISDGEAASRIERALPYLPLIQNTGIYALMASILAGLYDWYEPLTLENWRQADARIREKYNRNAPEWPREIFRRSGIRLAVTELCRGNGQYGDLLRYSLEWAFFARSQWGQYDTALLELEHAWEQEEPGAPLPVNAGECVFQRRIQTLADVKEAMEHYCARIPVEQVVSTAQHISTDIHFGRVTDEMMEEALQKRAQAGEKERDIYAGYVFRLFLKTFQEKCGGLLFQFSYGAEPLPFETGSKLRTESVFELAELLDQFPGVRFQAMLANAHQNQAVCTLVRECPNLSVTGYWWHNFFPCFIRRIMEERLDMLPLNQQAGYFSDAYCADWMYAKSKLVRALLAEVLAAKVENGQYSFEKAVEIARAILVTTPQALLKLD